MPAVRCGQRGHCPAAGAKESEISRQILKNTRKTGKRTCIVGAELKAGEQGSCSVICSYAGAVGKGRAVSQEWFAGFIPAKSGEEWRQAREAAAALCTHGSGIPSSPPTRSGFK